jgi:hypothetical protein
MRVFFAVCTLGAALTSVLGAQRKNTASAVALVQRLYSDFACDAAVDPAACGKGDELTDQPKPVLSRYFDDQFGASLLRSAKTTLYPREDSSGVAYP